MTNEQIIKNMSAQIEQIKKNIENWAKLIQHICKARHLEIKDEPEKKLDMEFCQRCDVKTNQGRWWNDEFYCESCLGYFEAKAEAIVDLQAEEMMMESYESK